MHADPRPLSPHLQVYRWRVTMWLSTLHRITGLLLSLGALALATWLIAAASGRDAYSGLQQVFAAPWFKVPLVAWAFCFFLHLGNGVRHLFWDVGLGFDRARIVASGWTVLGFAVLAAAVFAGVAIF